LIVDVFNHFYPKEYLEALPKSLPNEVAYVSSTLRGITDLQYRLNLMDKYGVDMQIGFVMGQGKGGGPPAPLRKAPMEYMKMFYVDTAEGMWKPAMVLAHGFYGSKHMLFGTDYPWGDTPRIIENINGLGILEEERKMILGENAVKLFKLR
jgi:hypothetical protein